MTKGARSLYLDVCDYNNNIVCNLYDNHSNVSGQAANVYVRTERNGWKELSFTIPTTCFSEEGEEPNYRLDYLIADYRLRLKTEKEIDYYIISEPRIIHQGKAKNVEVTAGHISQLLKTKNLNLEFSDEEGNNVGTAEQLLTTILEGTGWTVGNVAEFLEDDGVTTKVRSFVSSAKTGAFMMVATMCEKFEAKPIYHGDTRTVDIVPMNPFAAVDGAEIPQEVLEGKNVLELNYGHNVSGITRTLNTENLVTRLYAYGSYGDKIDGLCSLQTVEHNEYLTTLSNSYPAETEFYFKDKNNISHYFSLTDFANNGDKLIWSDMDPVSMSYVWNETQSTFYSTYSEPKASSQIQITFATEAVPNWLDYLMDFDYYEKIGLLTSDMKQTLASFQRTMPAIVETATNASTALIQKETELSHLAESNTGFLRLDVDSYSTGTSGELILHINKLTYPDGIIYRSDYDSARRNYFSWYCADALKDNGDPVSGIGSVVYIVHDSDPVKWEKAYVKHIDGTNKIQDYSEREATDPNTITLWLTASKIPAYKSTDRFYLFSTNSISGQLGVRESEIESLQQTLDQATKIVTEKHPTYFVWDNDPAPDNSALLSGYGWYYRTYSKTNSLGDLYFCYGASGDTNWRKAFVSDTMPSTEFSVGDYYFDLKQKNLYHRENSGWINLANYTITIPGTAISYAPADIEVKRICQAFSKVNYYCRRFDMLHKGLYEKYKYTCGPSNSLAPGNYAIQSEYGFFWVFSTDIEIQRNKSLWVDTDKYLVYQDEQVENVVPIEAKPYEAIDFPSSNDLKDISVTDGSINTETGVEINSNSVKRTNHIPVYGNVTYSYNLPNNTGIFMYDGNRKHLSNVTVSGTGNIYLSNKTKYVRLRLSKTLGSLHYFRVQNYQSSMFLKDTQYIILSNILHEGNRTGINDLMKSFADTSDECYLNYLVSFNNAQQQVKDADNNLKNTLQDLYKEGYWQKNEYVEGDETKLYKDALENLVKIAKPEATYDITFLDLYGSNKSVGYSVTEDLDDVECPDIDISDAIHLIDEEIEINCWAFIDKLDKCYDQPWNTQMSINTDLTLIAQHSFTDVLTRIAEVANETNAKQTIYKRAAAISGSGAYAADKLEGTIKANKLMFEGGMSNWYTDAKGNLVFESADGQSAMMMTGYGFCIASSKDEWGDWIFRSYGTGAGFSADEIVTGEMSAIHLTAGSITSDKLSASVGQELEIGSNRALLLYATEDGMRPAGGVVTPHNEGESFIQIAAKNGDKPAYINIATGGLLNLVGGRINLTSGSTFTVDSNNFSIDSAGNVRMSGTVTANAGEIAGFTIGQYPKTGTVQRRFMYSGLDSLAATGTGVYIGTDGINIGGKFIYSNNGNTAKLRIAASDFLVVSTKSGQTKESTLADVVSDLESNSVSNFGWQYALSNSRTSAPTIGWSEEIPIPTTQMPYLWIRKYLLQTNGAKILVETYYSGSISTLPSAGITALNIASGRTSVPKVLSTGISIDGNKIEILSTGSVQLVGNAAIYVGTSSSNSLVLMDKNGIAIGSGKSIGVASGGDIMIASGGKLIVASSDIYLGSDTTAETLSNSLSMRQTTYVCPATGSTGILTKNYQVGETWTDTDTRYQYMCVKVSSRKVISDWQRTGTAIIGARLSVNAETGVIDMSAANNINIAAGANVSIAAGKKVSITTAGMIDIGNAGKAFTIGANATDAYIYNGITSLNDSAHDGVYVGTDGISLGKGAFKVTSAGVLNATSATIKGQIDATSGHIGGDNGWTIGNGLIYSDSQRVVLSAIGDYRFYAGNTTPGSAAFYVKSTGEIKATSGTVGGWQLGEKYLRSTDGTVGIYSDPADGNKRVFWAGGVRTPSSGQTTPPFYVTGDGKLYATGVDISGAINATSLKINGKSAMITLDDSGHITLGSITDGGKLAKLNVDNNNVSTLVWDSASQSASTVTIASNKVSLSTTGNLEIQSGNFTIDSSGNVSMAGTITATGGRIGGAIGSTDGWNIQTNRLFSRYVQAGAAVSNQSSYIELNTNAATQTVGGKITWVQPYALWIGHETAEQAPFRVTRNGEVYITKLMVKREDNTIEEADLFNPSLYGYRRKSDGAVVTSSSSSSITLSNGTTINFKTAADIDAAIEALKLEGSWQGNVFSVKIASNKSSETRSETFSAGTGLGSQSAGGQYTINSFNSSHRAYGYVDASSLGRLFSFNVDATSEYNAGKTAGESKFVSQGDHSWYYSAAQGQYTHVYTGTLYSKNS